MIQDLRLGLLGTEVSIPTLGRSISSFGYEPISLSGRASDGTLHEDFVNLKRSWAVLYSVISEADSITIFGFYNLQFTNNTFLSMIITDQAGSESSYTVRMGEPQHGALIQRDVYYYQTLSFTLQEA